MHANFEKEKFHKQSVVILLKNGCSVKHVLYNIYSFICGKSLENTFEAWPTKYYCIQEAMARCSSYLVLVFFKENSHSHLKFTERLFLLQLLYSKLFELICFRTAISGQKNHQNISTKIKSGDRLWVLETTLWKLCFYGKLFCIRQNLKLSQFCRVSLDDLRALLINTFEKLPLINSEINLRPPQHLKSS